MSEQNHRDPQGGLTSRHCHAARMHKKKWKILLHLLQNHYKND